MRLWEVFRFEVGHQVRQPATWLYLALLLGITLLLVAGGANPVGTGSLFNAPLKIATFTLFVGLMGTLVTAGLFVEAGHRDLRWRMDPLFDTAPLRKRDYLGGRFLGVLLINALLLLAIPAGLLLNTRLGSVDQNWLGPFRPEAYLLPYLCLLLPSLLFNAALLFGITVRTQRSLPGYLGALGLLGVYLYGVNATVGWEGPRLVALLDPTGKMALTAVTEGWTRSEQDARLVTLEGVLLWNRLLWTVLGAVILAYAFRLSTARVEASRHNPGRSGRTSAVTERSGVGTNTVVVPAAPRTFAIHTRVRQALAVASLGVRQTVLSREFLLVTLGFALLALLMCQEAVTDPRFGITIRPLTHAVVPVLAHPFMEMLIALLSVFYAGELVWSERDAQMEKIGDSVPVPDWVPFIGKFLVLGLMLVLLQVVLMASGMLSQALHGYYSFKPGLYVQILFGLQLADYLLFAVLALLAHVLVNQKYVGHLVAALLFVAILQARRLGIEHNLVVYGSDSGWVYSDFVGIQPFVAGVVWFKLYWAAWALLLTLLAAGLFWVRGTEVGLRARLRSAKRRFTPRLALSAVAGVLLVLSTGGFVYYNTNVLNEYRTSWARDAVHAEHERRYKRFEHVAQPWLTGTRLQVEVYPERREIEVHGVYQLVNRTGGAIDSVHVSSFPSPEITLRGVRFDRPNRAMLQDDEHGYRIYRLQQPLQPGDSLRMGFEVRVASRGFRNQERVSANSLLVGEYTHVSSPLLLPAIGYQGDLLELSGPTKRREHKLPLTGGERSIHDAAARHIPGDAPNSDWIHFEGTVGTAAGQVAVLPGALRRSWMQNGRRYFHYRAETPITNAFGLISAEYAVHRARWKEVDLRVLHHPEHAHNVGHLVRSAQASLDYLTTEFGPYPFPHLWLVEFPRYGRFARAYPGSVIYSESHPIALARLDDEAVGRLDVPLLVTAHEIAHQWWGKQVLPAQVQGSGVLGETLAQYSAAMVLERIRGEEQVHRYLRSMQLGYLDGRRGQKAPEVPLLLSSDHDYVHYLKGTVVMYALRDYIGESRVNAALRRLVEKHAYEGPPYATALDLYNELQAVTPDSVRYLLRDLFAAVTLWDLQVTGARAETTGTGEYRVNIAIDAKKLRADSIGNDTEVPMNDPVDVGIFSEDGKRLYLRKHRIRSGQQEISVTVRGKPARAGIDPHHKLITGRLEGLLGAKFAEVETSASAGSGLLSDTVKIREQKW